MKLTHRAAAAITAACLAVLPAAAADQACVKGPDEVALQTRVIQTDLMVAALSCGASARYNEFVKANQPVLMAAHSQLTKFFTKARGGQKALNTFITKLANDSSRRSIANIAAFCQETGWLYDAILSPTRGDFVTFIGPLLAAQRHGFVPCEAKAQLMAIGPTGPMPATVAVAAAPSGAPAAAPAAAPQPAAAPPAAAAPKADTSGVPTPKPKPTTLASR
jgi:hypothetical protein